MDLCKWCATVKELVEVVKMGSAKVGLSGMYQGLTDDEAADIADAVAKSTAIEILNLSNSKLTDAGATYLAEAAAKSTSLTALHLGYNKITDVGASALAKAVTESTSFRNLWLCGNHITDAGAKALSFGVQNSTSLKSLYISDNQITEDGACALLRAVVRSRSCEDISFASYFGLNARARSIRRSALATLAMMGKPGDQLQKGTVSWLIDKDGDHAIWSRVTDYLV